MNVRNRDTVEPFQTKDTSLIREIMAPWNSDVQRQSLAEATIAVGMMTQAHYHPETEEIYYIVQGAGEMALEGELRNVRAGDAICIRAGQPHQIRNVGTMDLVILCSCVPAYRDSDTVLCSSLFSRHTEFPLDP